jgi:hypothetical protein
MHGFYIAITPKLQLLATWLHKSFLIILEYDPCLDTYLFPIISGVMVSIIAFGKLCSGAKTLGWEH